ncbi:MAG TPA: type II secretion system F family protein [Acidimicrobiales bacterium]|jgi:tight adherence protein C|nr:type II secretion system F family protein [Acidimicrobiales bacterium]
MGAATVLFLMVAAGGLALLAVTALRAHRAAPDFDQFLDGLDLGPRERRLAEPFLPRIAAGAMRAVANRLERLLPGNYVRNVDRQLVQAGLSGRRRAGEQVAVQVGLAVLGAALIPVVPATTHMARMACFLLPVMGFMLPSARLKRAVRRRSDAIFKDLPDIVDMLAIAVEAGSGFEAAISIVCENFDSPLTDELMLALQEMELGLPRREALQQLRDRVDLNPVRTLVLALLQADALGIPIGRVLKAQANEVRARRRAWAREQAAKLPVKIMFPLVLFIFPPIMALVLGPAAFSFSKLG